jgi:hypothetical protein
MRIKTDLRAGLTFEQCDAQRNYWKQAAQTRNCSVVLRDMAPPPTPSPIPPPVTPPSQGQSGCSWVNGVYYPDMSGDCG